MLPTCLHHDENRQKTYVSSTKGFLFPSHVSEDCCSYQFWMTIDQLTIFGWNISKFILTKEMRIQNKKFQILIHHWFKNEKFLQSRYEMWTLQNSLQYIYSTTSLLSDCQKFSCFMFSAIPWHKNWEICHATLLNLSHCYFSTVGIEDVCYAMCIASGDKAFHIC